MVNKLAQVGKEELTGASVNEPLASHTAASAVAPTKTLVAVPEIGFCLAMLYV
ncbi:MAG: hypothetical protein VXZ82_05260 [Planctomycetota bacterium]|nr:hypothetical protein [Planctomycetota bacterium]